MPGNGEKLQIKWVKWYEFQINNILTVHERQQKTRQEWGRRSEAEVGPGFEVFGSWGVWGREMGVWQEVRAADRSLIHSEPTPSKVVNGFYTWNKNPPRWFPDDQWAILFFSTSFGFVLFGHQCVKICFLSSKRREGVCDSVSNMLSQFGFGA